MEIGGATPCTEHDQLSVQQTLILNNPNLTVVLINGFSPTPDARFDILDWSALGGTFGNIDFSQAALVAGLNWDTSALTTSGELVVPGPALAQTVPLPLAALVGLGMALGTLGWSRCGAARGRFV